MRAATKPAKYGAATRGSSRSSAPGPTLSKHTPPSSLGPPDLPEVTDTPGRGTSGGFPTRQGAYSRASGTGRSGRSFARLTSLARLEKEEAHGRGTQGRDAHGRWRRAWVERCDPGRHNEVCRGLRLRGRRPEARLEVPTRSRARYGHAPRRR